MVPLDVECPSDDTSNLRHRTPLQKLHLKYPMLKALRTLYSRSTSKNLDSTHIHNKESYTNEYHALYTIYYLHTDNR